MDIINKNIRSLRKLEKIKSQSVFGNRLGVPSHNINKYENNVIPKPEVLRKIAEEFKINLHLFFTKELTEANYEEFKIEHNTEAKLSDLIDDTSSQIELKRGDLNRFATFFDNKLVLLEEGQRNENDRLKLFRDIRSIFLAYNQKTTRFLYHARSSC